MNKLRITSMLTAALTGLVVLLGVGSGHSLLSQAVQAHHTGESMSRCQTICPPLLQQSQQVSIKDEDDDDPEPLPFTAVNISQIASLAYSVALAALLLLFWQRKPPDLVLLGSNWRN